VIPALILGGASCVWNDVDAALSLGEFFAVVACNDIGTAWAGELDAWVTLHPENMEGWIRQRASRGYPPAKRIVYHQWKGGSPKPDLVTAYNWHRSHKSASSGVFAAKVALEIGCERGVLCGVPLTMTAHFNDRGDWSAATSFHDGLMNAEPYLRNKVRSMSGRTKEILGVPTPEWLAGSQPS
jgi:hypothetical protein